MGKKRIKSVASKRREYRTDTVTAEQTAKLLLHMLVPSNEPDRRIENQRGPVKQEYDLHVNINKYVFLL